MVHRHFAFLERHGVAIRCRLGAHRGVFVHLLIHEIIVEDICPAARRVIPEEGIVVLAVLPLRLGTNRPNFLILLVDSRADRLGPG